MDKKTMSQQGKKKMTRNILIGAAIAIVVAVAIFLIVALQPDGKGMNCFQRNATVASADGVKISMSEYRVTLDSIYGQYAEYLKKMGLSDEMIREYQENAAEQALMQKIYIKEGKALGMTLTKEEQDSCKKAAKDYIEGIEQQYIEYMVQNGTYSKTAFEKEIANYYRNLGMNKNAYEKLIRTEQEAELYRQKLATYFTEKFTPDDATLVQYYRDAALESMYEEKDGEKTLKYKDGQVWEYMEHFRKNEDVPMLYLPEGFIFIDLVKLEAASAEAAQAEVDKINSGESDFDTLLTSADNKDAFKGLVNGPYPIAEKDHKELFEDDELYTLAASMEVGEMKAHISELKAEDGTATYTVYLVRRAEGNIFMEGEERIIKMDYFTDMKEIAKNRYVSEKSNEVQRGWLADEKFEDALYTYKGALG